MLVDAGALQRPEVGNLDAFDQLHREHAPRGQIAIDLRDHDVGAIGEIGGDDLAVARLVDEVELHRNVLQNFARDHAEVEIGLEPCEQAQREIRLRKSASTIASMRGYCTLTAQRRPSRVRAAMDLGERGGGDRHRVELAEDRFERASEFTLDLCANYFERARRYAVVQSGERRDPFVRQNIGAGCDKLARLDQQPSSRIEAR